jgi:membrane protease YdiL (CAAX protease family)
MLRALPNAVQRYPVLLYVLLALSVTWGCKYAYALVSPQPGMIPFNFGLIASWGPSIAAVLLISLKEGKPGLLALLKRLMQWRVGVRWLFFAMLFEPVLFFSITLAYRLWYGYLPMPAGTSLTVASLSLLLTFIIGIFRWGLAEEIGWRGWMLPRLLERWSPFTATMILAVVTTIWHVHPMAFPDIFTIKEGTCLVGYYPEVVERLIITIPITLAETYLFYQVRGRLLPFLLFHSASNSSYFWVMETFGITQSCFFKTSFLLALILIGIVFSVLVHRLPHKQKPA